METTVSPAASTTIVSPSIIRKLIHLSTVSAFFSRSFSRPPAPPPAAPGMRPAAPFPPALPRKLPFAASPGTTPLPPARAGTDNPRSGNPAYPLPSRKKGRFQHIPFGFPAGGLRPPPRQRQPYPGQRPHPGRRFAPGLHGLPHFLSFDQHLPGPDKFADVIFPRISRSRTPNHAITRFSPVTAHRPALVLTRTHRVS